MEPIYERLAAEVLLLRESEDPSLLLQALLDLGETLAPLPCMTSSKRNPGAIFSRRQSSVDHRRVSRTRKQQYFMSRLTD